ncbi:chloride channel protein [Azohydromonas lata]|uniref:chloride channel protein n=1 Tax=Azohydromonas lata TaxID=45677 RepID=UPI001EE3B928|nr:chloride channel protein [Azohydromonas lata]
MANWREWLARIAVLVHAGLAGAAVVAFTWLTEQALRGFHLVQGSATWLPLLWTPACCGAMAWLTLRHFPSAAGSGIPQVMAALDPVVDEPGRHWLVSLRLSLAKMLLTAGGLLGGLAIGREGPSVQIAAGVMHNARRWLPAGTSVSSHALLIAGGAAGIAAAFNAPLAGVMFAIEELHRKIEHRSSGLIICAIVLAGVVGVSAFGNAAYFGVIRVPATAAGWLWSGVAVVLVSALAGGVFARLLHASLTGTQGRIAPWRRQHPVAFASACGLAIAALGLASGGTSWGSGYEYTRGLLEGSGDVPGLYVLFRFVATWLAAWSGVPGGIFAPSLAIGAGIGHDIALLWGPQTNAAPLIALGMTAFLAAVTRAPLTAFIIVMEMVDGHAMVLSLMAAALGASLVSRWIGHPLYELLSLPYIERAGRLSPAAPQARPA